MSRFSAVVCGALLIAWARASAGQAGAVVGWGMIAMPPVQAGTRFTAIAAGLQHNLALKSDGTVQAWGHSEYGDCAVPPGLNGVVAIAAGNHHCLAVKSDGTIVGWGDNSDGESVAPAGLTGVVAVAAGADYSLALKSDGTVVEWGNTNGLAPPEGLNGVIAVCAGETHNLALESDGTVVAWGYSEYGEGTVPAGLSGVIAIAAGSYSSVALVGGPVLTPPALQPGGSAQLTLEGIAGWSCTVSASADLVNWTPLANFVATNAATPIVDSAAGAFSRRFYRAVAP
jgi:hypothetical protein